MVEAARRKLADTFEDDVRRVDDEKHLAPARDVVHHGGEMLCAVDKCPITIGQQLHDFQRTDAVFARDTLDDAVGVLFQTVFQRL